MVNLESLEISGLFAPIPNLCFVKEELGGHNFTKSLIHEDVHRAQHLLSSVGLMQDVAWRQIYDCVFQILSLDEPIHLPLKKSFLTLLKKLKANHPATADSTLSALSYLRNWSEWGVAKSRNCKFVPSLASVLCGDVELSISTAKNQFNIQDQKTGSKTKVAITPKMILESMAYFQSLHSMFAFYLGKNKYLSAFIKNDEVVQYHRELIDRLDSSQDVASIYYLDPMPAEYRLPHIYLISRVSQEAFENDTFDAAFGMVNTVAVASALIGADYVVHEKGPFLPDIYVKALVFLVSEYLKGWNSEKICFSLLDPKQMRLCMNAVINEIIDPNETLTSIIERQLRLWRKRWHWDNILGAQVARKQIVLNAIAQDPTYIFDSHNLINNLFPTDEKGYMFGEKCFVKSMNPVDRYNTSMTVIFTILWNQDNLGCHIANSTGTWDTLLEDQSLQYVLCKALTQNCGDYKACRRRILRGKNRFCSNDHYKSQIETLLNECMRFFDLRDKLQVRVKL